MDISIMVMLVLLYDVMEVYKDLQMHHSTLTEITTIRYRYVAISLLLKVEN